MMKGRIDGGTLTVTLDINFEKLTIPDGRHYLPCYGCGDVQLVNPHVIGFICERCQTSALEAGVTETEVGYYYDGADFGRGRAAGLDWTFTKGGNQNDSARNDSERV
jgi:hypothetical protein